MIHKVQQNNIVSNAQRLSLKFIFPKFIKEYTALTMAECWSAKPEVIGPVLKVFEMVFMNWKQNQGKVPADACACKMYIYHTWVHKVVEWIWETFA